MRQRTVCCPHGGAGRTISCGVVSLQAASGVRHRLLLFGWGGKHDQMGRMAENAIDIHLRLVKES